MTTRKTTDPEAQWKLLCEAVERWDAPDPDYPLSLVKEELRGAGADPEAIGKRAEALVSRLSSQKRAASKTRLRSQPKTPSSLPPVREKAPSETGPISEE